MKRNVLNELYPFDKTWKRVIPNSFFFGGFIFLLLFVFQPFGISTYESDEKIFHLLGYGLVTTVVLLLNNLIFSTLFSKWYAEFCWTVGKNILFVMFNFFTIGLGNLLYSNLMGFISLTLKAFVFYQSVTIIVGLIPVTISTLLVYHSKMKKALKEAKALNNKFLNHSNKTEETISIPSQNKSEELELKTEGLLFVKSVENYVEVHFENNGNLKKNLLRNTLKNVHTSLSRISSIEKCHRSYLVNLDRVIRFSGNAQGLTLSLSESGEIQVPVSRSYVQKIKDALTN